MKVEQIHHVTVIVDDLDKACDFYEQVLGLEPINMVPLDFPAQFYKIGERQQLHVTEWEDVHSFRGHVCLQVDEFMPIFRKAKALNLLDTAPWGKTRMLPDGAMQMFLRDPSGNLIEISCKPGTPVDADVFADPQVEPERGVFVSGRNDPRGRRRATTFAEAEAVNASAT
jgi:catechol 2,3-dioxygenase-like lactoylglutathione lyase family enzyme